SSPACRRLLLVLPCPCVHSGRRRSAGWIPRWPPRRARGHSQRVRTADGLHTTLSARRVRVAWQDGQAAASRTEERGRADRALRVTWGVLAVLLAFWWWNQLNDRYDTWHNRRILHSRSLAGPPRSCAPSSSLQRLWQLRSSPHWLSPSRRRSRERRGL